jgi:hypothetical protein
MLRVITDRQRVADSQAAFRAALLSHPHQAIETTIGYQSGSVVEDVFWFQDLRIWGYWGLPRDEQHAARRYWNAFGVGMPEQSVGIVCEINPPRQGPDRRTAGAFAHDPSGRLFLLHRGRFNIHGGMTMAFFEAHYPKPYIAVEEGSSISRFIQVGEISAPGFGQLLSSFVFEVDRIKHLARRSS